MASVAWGQTLQGRVLDSDQQPVIGAYLSNGKATAATDINGAYSLTLTPGSHTVVCSFIGMARQEKTVTLAQGETLEWNPVMASAAEALGLVVVSAGRFEQDASEVTVSLEVLQPALVENKATTSLETAIEQTPGVSLVDGEPQIRSGSGFSYGAGSRVMVLVDDLPVLSGDAGRPTWGFLPLENLEQIEVIKGASSVLYGSAALSGVINIRTRYPDARPLTRISLQHGVYSDPKSADVSKYWEGSLQQSNLRFLHSQRIGGWDVVVGGNVLADDGYKGPEIYQDSVAGEFVPVDTASMAYNPFTVDRWGANAQARVNLNIRRRETGIEGLKFGLNTNWQKGESLNSLIWDEAYAGLYGTTDGAATRTKQLVGTVDPYVEYLSWRNPAQFPEPVAAPQQRQRQRPKQPEQRVLLGIPIPATRRSVGCGRVGRDGRCGAPIDPWQSRAVHRRRLDRGEPGEKPVSLRAVGPKIWAALERLCRGEV